MFSSRQAKSCMGVSAPKGSRRRPQSPLVAPAGAVPPATIKIKKHGCALRRFPKGDRRLRLFSLPFGRLRRGEISCLRERAAMSARPAAWSRPFGATMCKYLVEQLGGASADAQSYWQGRFAACTFVGGFLGVERPKNSWGVAQPPTRELRPLTLFLRPSLSAFPQLYAFAAFFPYSQIGSCPNVGTTCVQKTSCANTTVAVLSHGWNAIRPSRFTSWSKTS